MLRWAASCEPPGAAAPAPATQRTDRRRTHTRAHSEQRELGPVGQLLEGWHIYLTFRQLKQLRVW